MYCWISEPWCEQVAPIGVRSLAERIEATRHVAGEARVAVLPPRAADLAGLLEDRERLDPGVLERAAHDHPGEAVLMIATLGAAAVELVIACVL